MEYIPNVRNLEKWKKRVTSVSVEITEEQREKLDRYFLESYREGVRVDVPNELSENTPDAP